MGQHQTAGVQLALEPVAVHARLAGDGEGALVDLDDPVEAGQVDYQTTANRHRAALGAGAAPPRHNGHAVLACDPHGRGHPGLGRRSGDELGPSQRLALRLRMQGDPVRVGHEGVEALRLVADDAVAELSFQIRPELVGDGGSGQY